MMEIILDSLFRGLVLRARELALGAQGSLESAAQLGRKNNGKLEPRRAEAVRLASLKIGLPFGGLRVRRCGARHLSRRHIEAS